MKRISFVFLAMCLISFSSFASVRNIPAVLQSFFKTFQNAQNVNWTEVDGMLRIGFVSNGQTRFAYYSNDQLIVVATEMQTEELPASLKNQLTQYKGVVTQAYEINNNNEKEYYVVMESPSKHIVLKGKNKWRVYLEEKK